MRWNNVINLVSAHAEGCRGDVIVGGLPPVPGETVHEKMRYFEANLDHLRCLLNREPRRNSPLNFIVPASDPDAAFGFIIGLPTEYVAMSGSNTICVATVLLETGMHPMTEPLTEFSLEAPAGIVRVRCECRDGKVTSVSFLNQPAFVYHRDACVEIEGHGTVKVDVAWGGMTYAFVDAASLDFSITTDEASDLVAFGQRVKAAADEQLEAVHPLEPDFAGITQTGFNGPLRTENGVLRSRNAVVVSPGAIDRCPCGSGTSARLALMHARGEIAVGQQLIHESIIDTTFTSWIEDTTSVGDYAAVRPWVSGQAWITSMQQIGLDPTDPFPEGYILNDIFPHADVRSAKRHETPALQT